MKNVITIITQENKISFSYAHENDILLEINKKNKHNTYPVLLGIRMKNVECIKLLINYTSRKKILLDHHYNNNDIDDNDNDGVKKEYYNNLIFSATYYDSIEIVKLLMDYLKENNS